MNPTINNCDVCGHEYTGIKCPHCVIKCQYCDAILGEDAIDSYFVGDCPHLVCFEDFNIQGISWINKKFENKFKLYSNEYDRDKQNSFGQDKLIIPFESEKFVFNQFAAIEKIEMIEHKLYANDGRYNPVFFYLIKNV